MGRIRAFRRLVWGRGLAWLPYRRALHRYLWRLPRLRVDHADYRTGCLQLRGGDGGAPDQRPDPALCLFRSLVAAHPALCGEDIAEHLAKQPRHAMGAHEVTSVDARSPEQPTASAAVAR